MPPRGKIEWSGDDRFEYRIRYLMQIRTRARVAVRVAMLALLLVLVLQALAYGISFFADPVFGPDGSLTNVTSSVPLYGRLAI